MQPKPIYFRAPRKCGIFGGMCEAVLRQVNYLIDEAAAVGKGANATISYVLLFLHVTASGKQMFTYMLTIVPDKTKTIAFYGT